MNDAEAEILMERGLRGRLSAEEEAALLGWFTAHPAGRAAWEEERALSGLLAQLPPGPLSSNFTAVTLAKARLETGRRHWKWNITGWRAWFPRLATGSVAVALAFLVYYQHRVTAREQMAQSVATVTRLANLLWVIDLPLRQAANEATLPPLPDMGVVENFDAIQKLEQARMDVDLDLLAALEK
jgi:anti-sigma factor RsiW